MLARVAAGAALLILLVAAFFGYRSYAHHRELRETLAWMDETYNPREGGDNFGRGHGIEVHYLRKGSIEEETERFAMTFASDGDCNLRVRSETFPIGVYADNPSVTTYLFNLRDIDPSTIKLKTFDLSKDVFDCSDPEQVKLYGLDCNFADVDFLTRNGVPSIEDNTVQTYTKLTGADHQSQSISKTNHGFFSVTDTAYAQRFAKALKHAVELCGGQPSKF